MGLTTLRRRLVRVEAVRTRQAEKVRQYLNEPSYWGGTLTDVFIFACCYFIEFEIVTLPAERFSWPQHDRLKWWIDAFKSNSHALGVARIAMPRTMERWAEFRSDRIEWIRRLKRQASNPTTGVAEPLATSGNDGGM
jgi:hypothetical protein